MDIDRLVLFKTWRSEIKGLSLFLFLTVLAFYLTSLFPASIVSDKLFTIFSRDITLTIPVFLLVPLFVLLVIIYRIYNVRFIITQDFVESIVGKISVQQRIIKVRYEDIKGIEVNQSLLGRILGIGDVLIGTAGTTGVEVVFLGIASPANIQKLLQEECDRRLKESQNQKKVVEAV